MCRFSKTQMRGNAPAVRRLPANSVPSVAQKSPRPSQQQGGHAPVAQSMPASSALNAARSVRQVLRSIAVTNAAGSPKTPCTRRNFVLSAAIHSTRMTVCDHRIGKKVYRVTSLRRRLTDCYEDRGACGLPDYQRVSNHVFLFAFQFAKLMGLYRVTLRKAQQRKHRTLSCPACHCSRLIDTGDSTQSRTICPGETGYEQADYYQKCHGCGTEIGIIARFEEVTRDEHF